MKHLGYIVVIAIIIFMINLLLSLKTLQRNAATAVEDAEELLIDIEVILNE